MAVDTRSLNFGRYVSIVLAFGLHVLRPRSSRWRAYCGIAISSAAIAFGGFGIRGEVQAVAAASEAALSWEAVESPPFAFTTVDGKRIESRQLRGKRVVLNFWATWCAPCQFEIRELNKLVVANGDTDVVVFGLSNESEETIREFVADKPVDYPLVSMRTHPLPSPYRDVVSVPVTFVIDRNGIIQYVRLGYVNAEELRATGWEAGDHQGPTRDAPQATAAG